MIRIILTLILQASSYASILGLYFTVKPLSEERPHWHWVALGLGLGIATFLLIYSIIEEGKARRRVFRSDRGIKKYMRKWISSPGRTVVFSRDLSWGNEDGTRESLVGKSERNELTIFLEKPTEFSDDLKQRGADIRVYGSSGFIPKSRFTIVGAGKQGARVAVGLQEDGKHVVYQFESGKHPIYALAEDLAELARKVEK